MKLSTFKKHLEEIHQINFKLENGTPVPPHFHVTEIGVITKRFIDCGGTVRNEEKISFQLWSSTDHDHRLGTQILKNIIFLSEKTLGIYDNEIEVEYQGETIGKYNLDFQNGDFILRSQQTDCLAKDNCGVPAEKPRVRISTKISNQDTCCTTGSGCC